MSPEPNDSPIEPSPGPPLLCQNQGADRTPRQEIPPHTTRPKLRKHLRLSSSLGRCPASISARDPAASRIPQTSRDPRSPTAPLTARICRRLRPRSTILPGEGGRRRGGGAIDGGQLGKAPREGFLQGGAPAS
ncbi:hypothetical protein NN561_016646 [Cricetulus griseus]